jgi:hypothetical protein
LTFSKTQGKSIGETARMVTGTMSMAGTQAELVLVNSLGDPVQVMCLLWGLIPSVNKMNW